MLDVIRGVPSLSAEPVDGEVVKDAMQPGGQCGVSLKGVGLLKGSQKCVLHQILGRVSVPHHRAGVSEQAGDLGSESATNVLGGHDSDVSA